MLHCLKVWPCSTCIIKTEINYVRVCILSSAISQKLKYTCTYENMSGKFLHLDFYDKDYFHILTIDWYSFAHKTSIFHNQTNIAQWTGKLTPYKNIVNKYSILYRQTCNLVGTNYILVSSATLAPVLVVTTDHVHQHMYWHKQ